MASVLGTTAIFVPTLGTLLVTMGDAVWRQEVLQDTEDIDVTRRVDVDGAKFQVTI